MADSILCTPVGLQTPEGIERVNNAIKAVRVNAGEVASLAEDFVNVFVAFGVDEDAGWKAEFLGLQMALERRDRALDELLRAVAGRKAAD